MEDTEDFDKEEKEEKTVEVEGEDKVPESVSDVLSLIKQDLRDFLEILPQETMKKVEKLYTGVSGDNFDFAMIERELPSLLKEIKNHKFLKHKDIRNVENNIVRLLSDFEKKATKAEAQLKEITKQNKDANKKILDLVEKNEKLYESRITDLKEDGIRKATEKHLTDNLEKLKETQTKEVKVIHESPKRLGMSSVTDMSKLIDKIEEKEELKETPEVPEEPPEEESEEEKESDTDFAF